MKKRFFKSMAFLGLGLTLFISCEKDDGPEPNNSAPTINDQSFKTPENIADTVVIGKVLGEDVDQDVLIFSITQNSSNSDSDLFEISSSGELKLVAGGQLDYEQKSSHELIVKVSDGELSNTAKVIINVEDVDEGGKPVIDDQSFTIEENSPLGSVVGEIVATDPDGDDLVFFFSSNQQTNEALKKFKLDDNVIKTMTTNNQGELNYEQQDVYVFDITAGDGKLSTRGTITVNIIDVNDAPSFAQDDTVSVSISESTGYTEDIINVPATDEDGDAITYSIKNDIDNLFEIKASGRVELQTGKSLDYETKIMHTFTAVATDSEGASEEIEVIVNVMDEDDTPAPEVNVSTLAGSSVGFEDGTGSSAKFNYPLGIELQNNGNLFVVDNRNKSIRLVTNSGVVSSWAGAKPGSSGGAGLGVYDLVTTPNNRNYVSDLANHVVYEMQARLRGGDTLIVKAGSKLNPGNVDGQGTAVRFNQPRGLAADASGNIYIADYNNHRIRKMTPNGAVTTVAGSGNAGYIDGNGSSAAFNHPSYLVVDSNGNIFVTDTGNHRIRKISPSGSVTTVAGNGSANSTDGPALTSGVNTPLGIAKDNNDNIYFVDYDDHKIRKLDMISGKLITLAGTGSAGYTDGDGDIAIFNHPTGIAVSGDGSLIYVTDSGNSKIRKLTVQ